MPARRDLLAAILAGTHRVALVDDPTDTLGTTERLRGEIDGVVDAAAADGLLVLGARAARYVGASVVEIASAPCMDATRRLARVRVRLAATSSSV